MQVVIISFLYGFLALYKLVYVSQHYKGVRWSSFGVGLHMLVIVIRYAFGNLIPLSSDQWMWIHIGTMLMTDIAAARTWWRDR